MAQQKKLTARQSIILHKIDQARNQVIENQLESEFLKYFKSRMNEEQLKTVFFNFNIDNMIEQHDAHYQFNLEKLNYFKAMRDDFIRKENEKAAKDAIDILSHYPDKIDGAKLSE